MKRVSFLTLKKLTARTRC